MSNSSPAEGATPVVPPPEPLVPVEGTEPGNGPAEGEGSQPPSPVTP
jgi:hypothetical protein